MNTKVMFASALSGLLLISVIPASADAATIQIKCEQRAGRARVSVDGRDLVRGSYKCMVMASGQEFATDDMPSKGDQLECDFDSDPGDVAAGATFIPANLLREGKVHGEIQNNAGTVASADKTCRVRDN
jgi:hypothetical protein